MIKTKTESPKPDAKDFKILRELELDARQSYRQIGKKIGVSKEVVLYRVKNMEKFGLIRGYLTEMDLHKLGFRMYPILFKFEELPTDVEKEIIRYIKSLKTIGWAANCEGDWDLNVAPRVRDAMEVSDFISDFGERFGDYVIEKQLMHTLIFNYFKRDFGFANGAREIVRSSETTEIRSVSDAENQLLEALSADARAPVKTLSERADVSIPTVMESIKRLKKDGIIQGSHVWIDYAKLGYSYYKIWINLKRATEKKKKELYSFLSFEPHVLWATETIGYYDLSIELEVPTTADLRSFNQRFKDRFSNIIKRRDTTLVTNEIVTSYFPAGKN